MKCIIEVRVVEVEEGDTEKHCAFDSKEEALDYLERIVKPRAEDENVSGLSYPDLE